MIGAKVYHKPTRRTGIISRLEPLETVCVDWLSKRHKPSIVQLNKLNFITKPSYQLWVNIFIELGSNQGICIPLRGFETEKEAIASVQKAQHEESEVNVCFAIACALPY